MDYVAIFKAVKGVLVAIQPILPLLAPYIVGMLKSLSPGLMEKVTPFWRPILSAVIGMVIAYFGGVVPGDTVGAEVMNLVVGGAMGAGGSKFRDLKVGKVYVTDKNPDV